MTASNLAESTPPTGAPPAPVKQWFQGEIEASYYGIPSRVPAASSDSVGRRYRLHIYRAAVLRAEPFEDKQADVQPTDSSATQTRESFFQENIQIAQLWGVRGPGTRYEGPIHDVSIARVQTRFHVVKDGKSYGTMRGYARGWLYLPPSAPIPEPVPPIEINEADRVEQPGVLIHESLQEDSANKSFAVKSADADRKREISRIVAERDEAEMSVDDDPNVSRHIGTSQKTEPPYFSLAAAVGLLLWFTCGAEQTLIWCLFMLPTLGMRRLVFEVLPDDRGIQTFTAVILLGALLSSGTIFASFRTEACWTLDTVPLIVLVGSVFLSGIVPYRLPLAITALAFAGVLYVWGHAPERHCPVVLPHESLPTIKDPGVPRTNDDGTWPRRSPASVNE